jgi:DNA-binding NarL/FixJ family response regulator
MKPRLLLADDHQIVIEGLRRILESEFEIAAVAADGLELVKAAADLHPDVIVTDVTMPLLNGLEAARQILQANRKARIVFLTMHPDVAYATDALDTGAMGYVLKTSAGDLLITAIREALQGRVYVTPSITSTALRARSGQPPQRPRNAGGRVGLLGLTARQREIARMVGEGRTTKEIAELLHLSSRTIEFHKYRAIDVLGLQSAAQLIQYAVKYLA